MDWTIQDLGAVGEFVGSLLVFFTVLFLALQIRQNTKTTRSLSVQQWNVAVTPQNAAIYGDEKFAELYLLGTQGADLDPVKGLMFSAFLIQSFNNFELLFYQHEQGTIDTEFFRGKATAYLSMFSQPGVQEFWNARSDTFYSSKFRAFVGDELA